MICLGAIRVLDQGVYHNQLFSLGQVSHTHRSETRKGPDCPGIRYVGHCCFIFQRLLGSQLCAEFKLWLHLIFFQAIYASVLPGELMRGYMTQFPTFPSWLGKHSSTAKHDRLVQDLALHMSLR